MTVAGSTAWLVARPACLWHDCGVDEAIETCRRAHAENVPGNIHWVVQPAADRLRAALAGERG